MRHATQKLIQIKGNIFHRRDANRCSQSLSLSCALCFAPFFESTLLLAAKHQQPASVFNSWQLTRANRCNTRSLTHYTCEYHTDGVFVVVVFHKTQWKWERGTSLAKALNNLSRIGHFSVAHKINIATQFELCSSHSSKIVYFIVKCFTLGSSWESFESDYSNMPQKSRQKIYRRWRRRRRHRWVSTYTMHYHHQTWVSHPQKLLVEKKYSTNCH